MDSQEALRLLKEGTAIERREAAMVLGVVGDARAVPSLAEALKADDPGLVQAVEGALWAIWCRSGNAAVDRVLEEASGQGLCHLALGQLREAVRCFRQALAIHPHLAGVQQHLAATQQRLTAGNGGSRA